MSGLSDSSALFAVNLFHSRAFPWPIAEKSFVVLRTRGTNCCGARDHNWAASPVSSIGSTFIMADRVSRLRNAEPRAGRGGRLRGGLEAVGWRASMP
jgi:hypothetical protein